MENRANNSALTIRVSRTTHALLRTLADQADEPMTDVLDKAVESYRRQRFLDRLNESFAALRADPAAWEDTQRDRDEWDATLSDGLE